MLSLCAKSCRLQRLRGQRSDSGGEAGRRRKRVHPQGSCDDVYGEGVEQHTAYAPLQQVMDSKGS